MDSKNKLFKVEFTDECIEVVYISHMIYGRKNT